MNELEARDANGSVHCINLATYPDTMPLLAADVTLNGIRSLLLRPRSLAGFMGAMFFVDALAARGHRVPELILPLVPGSRQDRLNAFGDFLFTAKSITKEINARNFPRVTILDPHSDVTPALIDRCRVMHAADCITVPEGKYACVISPDAGAEKRATQVASKLGVPLIHAWKKRNVANGELTGFGMQPLDATFGLALVVDDLCDGGGTFIGLGKLIASCGWQAHLWTTHGLYTKGTSELLKYYGHLYTTDSAPGQRDGVIEIKVCEKLLRGEIL